MYIYTLDYNKEEILMLIYHLHELKKATFKYYFADGNCASYISDFLSILDNSDINTTSLYFLPIDVVKKYNHRIVNKDKYIPLINKIYLLFSKMTPRQQKDFLDVIKTNSSPSENIDNIVKEALVDYYTFYFRKFRISYKNYNDVINLKYDKTNLVDPSEEPLSKTQPSNFKAAYKYVDKRSETLFGYRPYYIDINDIQYNQIQESEFIFLDFNVLLNKKSIELEMLNILSIKSFNVDTDFYSPMSWQLYSGINKKNYEGDLKFNNEIGFGITKKTFLSVYLGTLFNTGFDNLEAYVKPSVYLYCYPFKNNKVKIESNYKRYVNNVYYENSIASINKIDDYIFTVYYNNNYIEKSVTLEIKYNF